ncbi:MAG: PilZ domain-containing protein [Spirochaetales bacterium]|nr:PilZ domain-containing protein [Spirochaetales bacterium]
MVRTRHQSDEFYNKYHDLDVSFAGKVIKAIRMIPQKTYLRFSGESIPCILYSSSFSGARIIIPLNKKTCEKISLGNKTATLNLSFLDTQGKDPISIFINAKITGFTPYKSDRPDINFVTLRYSNKPPDELIFRLGEVCESLNDMSRRKERRLIIDDEKAVSMNLRTDKISLFCDGKRNNCIIRDISYSGAKVITRGNPETYLDKRVMLILNVKGVNGIGEMLCSVVHCEGIHTYDAENFIALGLRFDMEGIPESYKTWLKTYLERF